MGAGPSPIVALCFRVPKLVQICAKGRAAPQRSYDAWGNLVIRKVRVCR